MDKYITKNQIKVILDNAPKGVDKEALLRRFDTSGYTIQGYNDQEKVAQEQPSSFTGLEKAPFQATGEENLITGTAKAIGNAPRSAFELGKNVVNAVVNPIDTIKSVGTVVKGVGAKAGELLLENTDIGQKLLEKANQNRIAQGQPELKRDANGKLQAEDTPDLQAINQVGKFFMDRYGSLDKFKETAIEDPASVLADLSSVLTGGSSLLAKTGIKTGEIAKTVEPLNVAKQVAQKGKQLAGTVKETTAGRVATEVIPTATTLKQNQIVKALDLTQGDLASISKKTGNDVTDFIVNKNLIKNTPEEVADSLNDFRKTVKTEKANVVSQVKNIYTPEQIPSVIKGLDTILQDVDGVAGLEDVAKEIKTLKNKKTFTLEDVQNAQYLLDDNSNIYSKLGDAKSTSKAKGLDNIRTDIRKFIEDEVDKATGGQTNIRQLNNDIQTSYAIEDAINTRATRNLTRAKISLGDWAALGVGTTINPALGIGLYIGKKIVETPSFRLAFTKALNAKPIKTIKTILKEVKNKNVSPETQKIINELADTARSNIQLLESGANVQERTKSEKMQ